MLKNGNGGFIKFGDQVQSGIDIQQVVVRYLLPVKLVEKGMEAGPMLNFTERRILKELSKYILEQARLYVQI